MDVFQPFIVPPEAFKIQSYMSYSETETENRVLPILLLSTLGPNWKYLAMGHCDFKVGSDFLDTLREVLLWYWYSEISLLSWNVLIKYPIDRKLDVLANALETRLKLKMTLTVGRSGRIEKGWNPIAWKIDGGRKLFH